MSALKRRLFDFCPGEFTFRLGTETKIMGVLNVTPDSFSDGGLFLDAGLAEARALQMEREGAHFLDIGGESSRPGARPVPEKEEIRRVVPVVKRLAGKIKIPISVDTTKYGVARAALDEGAAVINDITALKNNKRLAKLIARAKAGVVLMHMRGTPRTMQKNPAYRDVTKDVLCFLKRAVSEALETGIPKSRILIDPGFGFGKTVDQNLRLLSHLDDFAGLGCPLLVGLSRKSFVGHAIAAAVNDRLYGSLGAAAVAVQRGAHVLRVHEVLPHRQLAALMDRTLATEGVR